MHAVALSLILASVKGKQKESRTGQPQRSLERLLLSMYVVLTWEKSNLSPWSKLEDFYLHLGLLGVACTLESIIKTKLSLRNWHQNCR